MGKFQVQPSKLIMCLALSLLAQGESGVQTLASPNKFIDDSKGPGSKGHINYSATVYISCIHLYIRGNCSNPWWTCLQFQRHLIRSSKWSNLDAPESIEPRWLAKIWPYRSLSIAPKKRQESQQNLLLQRIWVSGAELQPGESQNGGLEMFGRWFALSIRWFQGSSR